MAIAFVGTAVGSALNGGNVTLSLNTPTSGSVPSVGDVIVIIASTFNRGGNESRIGNALGYNEIANVTNTNRFRAAWKAYVAGEDGPVIEGTANASDGLSVCAIWFSGVDSSPISTTTTTATGSASPPDAPSITPAHNDCVILACGSGAVNDSTPGTVTNYTQPFSGTNANDANDASTAIAYRILTGGSGSPENPGAYVGFSNSAWVAATIALKPAVTITPTAFGSFSQMLDLILPHQFRMVPYQ